MVKGTAGNNGSGDGKLKVLEDAIGQIEKRCGKGPIIGIGVKYDDSQRNYGDGSNCGGALAGCFTAQESRKAGGSPHPGDVPS